MKRGLLSLLLAPLVLAGCVVTTPVPDDSLKACGANELQYLVGQPGQVLNGMRFSQDVRVIKPMTPVTMDFRSDRLNILLDDSDVITQVYCG